MRNIEARKKLYAGMLDKPDMQRAIDEYIVNMIKKHRIKTFAELLAYMENNFEPAYFRVYELGEDHYQNLFRQVTILENRGNASGDILRHSLM